MRMARWNRVIVNTEILLIPSLKNSETITWSISAFKFSFHFTIRQLTSQLYVLWHQIKLNDLKQLSVQILGSLGHLLNYRVPQKIAPIKQTKMVKHGRPINIPKGSKRFRNGKPRCFWQFGTLLRLAGHFWTISDKNQFVSPYGQSRVWRRCFWAKNHFLFEMVRKGPKGSQMVKKI